LGLLCASVVFAGTVTDIDGNVYRTVTIGTQVWMAENLKVTHYRNSEAIPNVMDNVTWGGLTTGAYCEFNNDVSNAATYGRLYNWYAVGDSRHLAPAGWHVASDAEWKQLEMTLGMSQAQADAADWRGTTEGGKLKEAGYAHWFAPNTGATNESGFSALPGGGRLYSSGVFGNMPSNAYFWSSSETGSNGAMSRSLEFDHSDVYRWDYYGLDMEFGFSVRCVKDLCCTARTSGDVDASGSVDISDLSAMVDYIFNSLPFPGTCFDEPDVDKTGSVDISDLQAIIDFLFNSIALPSCP
jgi:uncharacterized protein (TIGR02145 family)